MTYINSYKDQDWLLPPSIKQMIPKDHICFFVEEFVESLDFLGFDMISEGPGHPSYHPRIILKIILQGMLSKERSSRRLASACKENFVFMYLAEKVEPNFRTICRFRFDNTDFIKEVFRETVKLASKNDLVDTNLICTDGSKIKANANKRKMVNKEQIDKLDSVIDAMIEEDIKQDEMDQRIYGDREENLTNLDTKDLKEIVKNYRKSKNKEKVKETCEKAKKEFQKNSGMKQVSLTDPECRMMINKKGRSELAYNPQFTVDSKEQVILANDVCQDATDVNQLEPQVKQTKENIELKRNTKIAADCGYNSGENYKMLEEEQLMGYIPNQEQVQDIYNRKRTVKQDDYEYDCKTDEIIIKGERYKFYGMYKKKKNSKQIWYKSESGKIKKVPEFFRQRIRMKKRMKTKEGRQVYNMRKFLVEPVIGNIKYNLQLTEFSLRGLNGVRLELNIACIVHNLKKIWKARMRIAREKDNKILIMDFWILSKNLIVTQPD